MCALFLLLWNAIGVRLDFICKETGTPVFFYVKSNRIKWLPTSSEAVYMNFSNSHYSKVLLFIVSNYCLFMYLLFQSLRNALDPLKSKPIIETPLCLLLLWMEMSSRSQKCVYLMFQPQVTCVCRRWWEWCVRREEQSCLPQMKGNPLCPTLRSFTFISIEISLELVSLLHARAAVWS